MREILESVVSEGSGKNAYLEGYSIGGKTATSQTLPRSANRYISSFLGFTPAEHPTVLGLCIIRNPQGVYYGGTICAPVIRDIFSMYFRISVLDTILRKPENCVLRSPHLKFCFAKGGLLTPETCSYAAKQQVFHC